MVTERDVSAFRQPEKTITRADISMAVYRQALAQGLKLSRSRCVRVVADVLGLISAALVADKMVKLASFASFSIRQKKQRLGRNPKTGKDVPILPRRVVVFRASTLLKTRINSSATIPETEQESPNHADV